MATLISNKRRGAASHYCQGLVLTQMGEASRKKVAGLFQVALSVSLRTRPYGIAAFAGEVVVKRERKKKKSSHGDEKRNLQK